ncbi:MAG: hypothetical protein ACP5P6_02510 [Candidatus Saccharicenans sp.]
MEKIYLSSQKKLTGSIIPIGLLACWLFSLGLFLSKPIAHAHRYDLSIKLVLELFLVWMFYAFLPRWLNKKLFLIIILVAGLGLGFYEIKSINHQGEVTETYKSVFKDLEQGRNPYTSGRIYHRNESDQIVYQNFNYPPMELYPYWIFYRLGHLWNLTSLTLFLIGLQALAALILALTFKEEYGLYILAFLPLLAFSELHTNPAMTMLMLSIFLACLHRQIKKPSLLNLYLTAVIIGFGLLTKFLFIPIAAVYYFWRLDWRSWKNFFQVVSEGAVSIFISLLLMLPFGPWNVLKNTILFNLNLGERNVYTTFFPNILSGFFYLIKKPEFYPLTATAVMVLAVLFSRRLSLFSAMLFSAIIFLLVSPTPEPQYFGTMLLLGLAARMMEELPLRDWRPINLKTVTGG